MWDWFLFASLLLPPSQATKPCERVDGGSQLLSTVQKATLASRFPGWNVRRQCVTEVMENTDLDPKMASVAAGDYDGDGRTDVAVLLESAAADRTMVVVFMSRTGSLPVTAGDGSGYLGTISRGSRGHDYETERDFTYTSDAIFTGDFRCCGASFIWRDGKFVRVATDD
jgi:hypothetical protein